MEKKVYFKENWKEYVKNIFFSLLFFLTPLICCVSLCGMQGFRLSQLTPFAIAENDEVIYQKMVEGVMDYGMPLGYFGYNESHAIVGTFSTWSPVLLVPWIILGKLFGWRFGSPMVYNIVLLMFAMGIFYLLVKPDTKRAILTIFAYVSFSTLTWYTLCALPEASCYFLLIIFMGLYINQHRNSSLSKIKVIISFGIAILLTWMRPYYIILILLPSIELIKKSKKKIRPMVFCVIVFLCTGVGYWWINKNMCASYFTDLFDFSWISAFFSAPANVIKTFMMSFREYLGHVREGILGETRAGAQCAGLFLISICLLFLGKKELQTKKWNDAITTGIIVIFAFLTYCACVMIFSLRAAPKHFIEVTLLGILVICLKGSPKMIIAMTGILSWLFFIQVQYYPCHEKNEELALQIAEGQEQLTNSMEIAVGNDRWDNTVIWVWIDDTEDVWWRGLYAMPAGVGINLCTDDYVLAHWGNLQAKYLYTNNEGTIDMLCLDSGAELIADYGQVHVWQLRK